MVIKLMKKILKKKRILFPLIFLGELAIFITIAIIFDLETNNSLYGVIFAYILFGTFVWFLIKIIKNHKTKLSTIKINEIIEITDVSQGTLYKAIRAKKDSFRNNL